MCRVVPGSSAQFMTTQCPSVTLPSTLPTGTTSALPAVKCCTSKGSWRGFEAATSTPTAVDTGALGDNFLDASRKFPAVDSGTAATALEQHRLQLFVDALPVQPLYQLGHRSCEDLADAKEGCDRDGASGLHLLPVSGRERKNLS